MLIIDTTSLQPSPDVLAMLRSALAGDRAVHASLVYLVPAGGALPSGWPVVPRVTSVQALDGDNGMTGTCRRMLLQIGAASERFASALAGMRSLGALRIPEVRTGVPARFRNDRDHRAELWTRRDDLRPAASRFGLSLCDPVSEIDWKRRSA